MVFDIQMRQISLVRTTISHFSVASTPATGFVTPRLPIAFSIKLYPKSLAERMRADTLFLRATEEGIAQRSQAVSLEDAKRSLGDV